MPITSEDKVIIAVIIFGIGASIVLFMIGFPAIMISLFLGMALASLVFRFLGGISPETTFALKTFKLGGSLAALLATAFFINPILDKQTAIPFDELFEPQADQWIAIRQDNGCPIDVKIKNIRIKKEGKIQLETPLEIKSIALRDNDLSLSLKNDRWMVAPAAEPKESKFCFGILTREDLATEHLFSKLDVTAGNLYVSPPLPSGSRLDSREMERMSQRGFPFQLATGAYNDNLSAYSLADDQGHSVKGSLYPKQGAIVEFDSCYYLVAVIEANHTLSNETNWARFAFYKIQMGLR